MFVDDGGSCGRVDDGGDCWKEVFVDDSDSCGRGVAVLGGVEHVGPKESSEPL